MLRTILAKVTDSKRTPLTSNRHSKWRRALLAKNDDRLLQPTCIVACMARRGTNSQRDSISSEGER